jgi:S1/P1 Nuclease
MRVNHHGMMGVHAWGKLGHVAVGNLAWRLLSENVQDKAVDILQYKSFLTNYSSCTPRNSSSQYGAANLRSRSNEVNKLRDYVDIHCTPLGQVADWADLSRRTHAYYWSGPLHYVDVHDDQVPGGCKGTNYTSGKSIGTLKDNSDDTTDDDFSSDDDEYASPCTVRISRDCPQHICAIGGIHNYTQRLNSRNGTAGSNHQAHEDYHERHHNYAATSTGRRTTVSSSLSFTVSLRSLFQQSTQQPDWSRAEAVMFLTHLVGDVHQPLHVALASDKGGNEIHVRYNVSASPSPSLPYPPSHQQASQNIRATVSSLPSLNYTVSNDNTHSSDYYYHRYLYRQSPYPRYAVDNLHAVWDDGIIGTWLHRDHHGNTSAWEDEMYRSIQDAQSSGEYIFWSLCANGAEWECLLDWARESWHLAYEHAYRHVGTDLQNERLDGENYRKSINWIQNNDTLNEDYYNVSVVIVKERLMMAAVRLAITLEKNLGM